MVTNELSINYSIVCSNVRYVQVCWRILLITEWQVMSMESLPKNKTATFSCKTPANPFNKNSPTDILTNLMQHTTHYITSPKPKTL